MSAGLAPQPLVVPFTKMDGAGNDFVVLDNRFFHFSDAELEAIARRFCPRRTGVGADGLLALDPPQHEGDHFRMRYRNADGSLATMCGNGARCLARFARDAGLEGEALKPDGDAPEAPAPGTVRYRFATDAGPYTADVPAAGDVTLQVPDPRDWVPEAAVSEAGRVCSVWTGTEHAVVFVDDPDAVPLETVGAAIRHDAAFAPAGANANLVAVEVPGAAEAAARVRVRTFEKGVEAETLACGTGALAAAVAARLAGHVRADRVAVQMPGGTLHVGFRLDGDRVTDLTLQGPARTVYQGTLEWR